MPEDKNSTNKQANGGHGKGKNIHNQDLSSTPESEQELSQDGLNPQETDTTKENENHFPTSGSRKQRRRSHKGATKNKSNTGFAFTASKNKIEAETTGSKSSSPRETVFSRLGGRVTEEMGQERSEKNFETGTPEKQKELSEDMEETAKRKKSKGVFSIFFSFKNIATPKHEHHTTLAVRERHEVTPQEPVPKDEVPTDLNGSLGSGLKSQNDHDNVQEENTPKQRDKNSGEGKQGFFGKLLLVEQEAAEVAAGNREGDNRDAGSKVDSADRKSNNEPRIVAETNPPLEENRENISGQRNNPPALPEADEELSLPEHRSPFLLASPEAKIADDSFIDFLAGGDENSDSVETEDTVDSPKKASLLGQLAFWRNQPAKNNDETERSAVSGKIILAVRKQKPGFDSRERDVDIASGQSDVRQPVSNEPTKELAKRRTEKRRIKKKTGFLQKFGFGRKPEAPERGVFASAPKPEKVILAVRKPVNRKSPGFVLPIAPEHDNSFHAVAAAFAQQAEEAPSKVIFATRKSQIESAISGNTTDTASSHVEPEILNTVGEHVLNLEHFDSAEAPTPKKSSFWKFGKKKAVAEESPPVIEADFTPDEPDQDLGNDIEVQQLLAETERLEEDLRERSSESILKEFVAEEEESVVQNILVETERVHTEESATNNDAAATPSFFGWGKGRKENDAPPAGGAQKEQSDAGEEVPETIPQAIALPGAKQENLMLESHEMLLLDMPHKEEGQPTDEIDADVSAIERSQIQHEDDLQVAKQKQGFLQQFFSRKREVSVTGPKKDQFPDRGDSEKAETLSDVTEVTEEIQTRPTRENRQKKLWGKKISQFLPVFGIAKGTAPTQEANVQVVENKNPKVIFAVRKPVETVAAVTDEDVVNSAPPVDTLLETNSIKDNTTPVAQSKPGILQRISLFGKKENSVPDNDNGSEQPFAERDLGEERKNVILAIRKPRVAEEVSAPLLDNIVEAAPDSEQEKAVISEEPSADMDNQSPKKGFLSGIASVITKQKAGVDSDPQTEGVVESHDDSDEESVHDFVEANDIQNESEKTPDTGLVLEVSEIPEEPAADATDVSPILISADAETGSDQKPADPDTSIPSQENTTPDTSPKTGLLKKLSLPFGKKKADAAIPADELTPQIETAETNDEEFNPIAVDVEVSAADQQPLKNSEEISDDKLLDVTGEEHESTPEVEDAKETDTIQPEAESDTSPKTGLLKKLSLPFGKKKAEAAVGDKGVGITETADTVDLDSETSIQNESEKTPDTGLVLEVSEIPEEPAADATDVSPIRISADAETGSDQKPADSDTSIPSQENTTPDTSPKTGLLKKLSLPFGKKKPAEAAVGAESKTPDKIDDAVIEGDQEVISEDTPGTDASGSPEKALADISDDVLLGIAEDAGLNNTDALKIEADSSLEAELEKVAPGEEKNVKKKKLFSLFQKKQGEATKQENALSFLASDGEGETDSDSTTEKSAFTMLFQSGEASNHEQPANQHSDSQNKTLASEHNPYEGLVLGPDTSGAKMEVDPLPQDVHSNSSDAEAAQPSTTTPENVQKGDDFQAEQAAEESAEAEAGSRPDVLYDPVQSEELADEVAPGPDAPLGVGDAKASSMTPDAVEDAQAAVSEQKTESGGNILELRALPNDDDPHPAEVSESTALAQQAQGEPKPDEDPLLALLPQNDSGEQPGVTPEASGSEANPLQQTVSVADQQENPLSGSAAPLPPDSSVTPLSSGEEGAILDQQSEDGESQSSLAEKKNPFVSILGRFGLNNGNQSEAQQTTDVLSTAADGMGDGEASGQLESKAGEQNPFVQGDEENPFVANLVTGVQLAEKKDGKVLGENFSAQLTPMMQKRKEEAKKRRREYMMVFSKFVAGLSLLVPLASWIVFQTLLNPDSHLSEMLKAKNYGIDHRTSEANLELKNGEVKKLTMEVNKITKQIENIKNNKILAEITEGRVDFLEIMLRINRITLKSLSLTPELNSAINMLVFSTYSGRIDGDSVGISINGTVRDPKRMSWSKLTRLMETINKDEYFSGASIRSFSKTDDDEGGSKSSFSFNFTYFPMQNEELLSAAPTK